MAKQVVELCEEEMASSTHVVPDHHPEGQVGVVEGVGLLVHGDGENLTPPVDYDDAIAGVVLGRHEDGVSADPVLVDQSLGPHVVQLDVAVPGDQVDAVLLRNLQNILVLVQVSPSSGGGGGTSWQNKSYSHCWENDVQWLG